MIAFLERGVEQLDAVDLDVKVRSRAELGLVEVAVRNDLGVRGVSRVGVDVGHVAGLIGAAHGVGVGREDVDSAVGQAGLDFLELGVGAFGGNSLVQLKQLDGAGLDGAGPVGGNSRAVGDAVDDVLKVGSPVDAGGDDVGVGAGFLGGAVVG